MSRQNDSNDQSIDGDRLAEDDGDQILGFDPWGLDASAHDRGASGVDAEGGPHHRQGDGQPHPDAGPHVGRGLAQEPADVQSLTAPSEDVIKN